MSVFFPFSPQKNHEETADVASRGRTEVVQATLPLPPLKTEEKRAKVERKRKKKKPYTKDPEKKENMYTDCGGYYLVQGKD